MRKLMLMIICFMLSFTIGFVSAKSPLNVFIDDKELENNKGYILKDNKVYISEDVLKKDLDFTISYDKVRNEIIIRDLQKIVLQEKSRLFEEFAQEYEPETPDKAAELWAKGIKQKNGVFQYLVLSKSLKEDFRKTVGKQDKNYWVTGSSNIEIKDYKVTKENLNKSTWRYKIAFTTSMLLSGNNIYDATLIISKEDNRWRIIDIEKNFNN